MAIQHCALACRYEESIKCLPFSCWYLGSCRDLIPLRLDQFMIFHVGCILLTGYEGMSRLALCSRWLILSMVILPFIATFHSRFQFASYDTVDATSFVTGFSLGSSMDCPAHLMSSRYFASNLLESLCRWFRWYQTTVSSWWMLAPAFSEVLAGRSRCPKSSPDYDIMYWSLLSPCAALAFMGCHIVDSSQNFNSADCLLVSSAVSYGSYSRFWKFFLLLIIGFGTSVSSPSTTSWLLGCMMSLLHAIAVGFMSVYANIALDFDAMVHSPAGLVPLPTEMVSCAIDHIMLDLLVWTSSRLQIAILVKLVLPSCFSVLLLIYDLYFVNWVLPEIKTFVSMAYFIDRPLLNCSGWNDMVFSIEGYIDGSLLRCINKWIDWLLPTYSERLVWVHSVFDSLLPKYNERIMLSIAFLVDLKLPECNFVLPECNKSFWVDRINMMLPRCNQCFKQVAGVRDFALPKCNEWITSWFEYVFHSPRMNTFMDCLLPKCSNSIFWIIGLLSSWTAWFCMVSSTTWFTHLMLECIKIKWPRVTCERYVFPVLCLFA